MDEGGIGHYVEFGGGRLHLSKTPWYCITEFELTDEGRILYAFGNQHRELGRDMAAEDVREVFRRMQEWLGAA